MRRSPAALALLCAVPLLVLVLVDAAPASAAVDTTPPVVSIAGVVGG